MPLVRNTETGNHYLEKINTGSDTCGRTAIRSYHKTTATSGQTVFTLPFVYEPDSYTLWVFVNHEKAIYVESADYVPPGVPTQELLYDETGIQEVTFYYGLALDDDVEFIVSGSYLGEDTSGSGGTAPDLTLYKTRFGSDIGDGPPQNFNTNQPMAGYKFTGLPIGTASGDSVNMSQLGPYIEAGTGIHYHTYLYDSSHSPVIVTYSNRVDISGALGQVNLIGATPQITFNQSDGDDVRMTTEGSTFYFQNAIGATLSFSDMMTANTTTGETTWFQDMNLNGGAVNHQIHGVADGTDVADAATFGQLTTYRGIERIVPQTVYSIADVTPPGLVGNTATYDSGVINASGYSTVPAWATGLMLRVMVKVDQAGGVMGGTNNHSLDLDFAYLTAAAWETVITAEMSDAPADTDSTSWGNVCLQPYTAGTNNTFRFRWTYNKTAGLTLPVISVKIDLIGWYR